MRIISATHVDLESATREGRFCVDLFPRLCVLRVDEPPLPARGNDIEILAHHILHKFKTDSARKIRDFTPSAMEAMYNYDWPGNVLELINRVRRAILMAENKLISAGNLDLAHFTKQKSVTLSQAREAAEKRTIEAALLRHRHRLNEAAADEYLACHAMPADGSARLARIGQWRREGGLCPGHARAGMTQAVDARH